MTISNLSDTLNPAQQAAVCAPLGHYLVLAGAGSGKTRVLTQRIAWLHQTYHVPLSHFFVVTFTNKAAAEMRERIYAQLAHASKGLWVGTFHGLAHRLLRLHWQEANLPQSFQIMGNYEQLRLVKRVAQTLQLDASADSLKLLMGWINAQKEAGRRAQHIQPMPNNESFESYRRTYIHYQQQCENDGLLDFAELLLRANELLRDNPPLLAQYQQRFQHLLVDEFQDINNIQYAFIRLLAGKSGHVFAVGDDDQAIYSWRGAKVENIQHFISDFPSAKTLRLEQNYRSTASILNVANAVIAQNAQRMGKQLWTGNSKGKPVELFAATDDNEEANYVVQRIKQWAAQGKNYADIAVLYRTNIQARAFEMALANAQIPYRIRSGLHFFELAEIRDALAWLRLLTNHHDNSAFERAINIPKRGIGQRTLEHIQQVAQIQGVSLWEASQVIIQGTGLTARLRQTLAAFIELVEKLSAETATMELHELIDHVITQVALREHWNKASSHQLEWQSRCENLDQLVVQASSFATHSLDIDTHYSRKKLDDFLAYTTLENGETHGKKETQAVQLMTLHAAKGLEFQLVFLVGMEEGLLPSARSLHDPLLLNEERRLAYVGITRAQEHLILSYAKERLLYGKKIYYPRSRFLAKIPPHLLNFRTSTSTSYQPTHQSKPVSQAVPVLLSGTRVKHQVYGTGTVIGSQGSASHARVHIRFDDEGDKWLMLAYADLKVIPN